VQEGERTSQSSMTKDGSLLLMRRQKRCRRPFDAAFQVQLALQGLMWLYFI
jgi:hypothetical protein